MKKRYVIAFLFVAIHSVVHAQAHVPVDSISKVSFQIKNFGSTVEGSFKGLKGTIYFDASTLASAVFDVSIEASSIDSGIGMRDNHLRKRNYLDAANFPTIRFVSTNVVAAENTNEAIITGRLTIKKTTKEVSFAFGYSEDNGVLRFTGEFQINRREFDVGGSSISLANELRVVLDVRAIP
jgi:polyisoprenoid-binding protein YceI